jgi:N-acetylglucosaminyldiphosphoundecaprenol N-acetyl-beta-D-mannosaminyltransferase
LTPTESDAAMEAIRTSGADVVWVGLGMPKQELWMHRIRPELPGVALLGVGAAFDFLAGTKKQAPTWMQKAGMEWLFRLIQEPRRLWRRYVWNNPAYAFLLALQVIRHKLGRN